jgi:PAS domain-containing protein
MSNSEVNLAFSIADSYPDPIAILDTKGTILWCNNALYEVSQVTPEDIIGQRFTKLTIIRARDIPGYVKYYQSPGYTRLCEDLRICTKG